MVPRAKPAPDLFLTAAGKMGADPARTLVVEDSVNGVLAGKAAGHDGLGLRRRQPLRRERGGPELLAAAGADRVFDSMAEFILRSTAGQIQR